MINTDVSDILLTCDLMREAEQIVINRGISGLTLMQRAGEGVAHHISHRFPQNSKVLVLCGPGNNGGDGFVVARILKENGYSIDVALWGKQTRLKGDARTVAEQWDGAVCSLEDINIYEYNLIVDALFGTGLTRDIEGLVAETIEKINSAHIPVIAVDIPSGINGDTGQIQGCAVKATETVTFFARKLGHVLYPGRTMSGSMTVIDIGIPESTLSHHKTLPRMNNPSLWTIPEPDATTHKYKKGHTLVCSGEFPNTGASRLSALGALRIGSGLVTIAAPKEALATHAAHVTSIMLRSCEKTRELEEILKDKRFNALVIGPGFGVGRKLHDFLSIICQKPHLKVVIDADALMCLAEKSDNLGTVLRETKAVLTPHEGEFQRLFASQPEILDEPSKVKRTLAASRYCKAALVYKGADTVIAWNGQCVVNTNGTADLATAGSGDVLSGFIAGFLAQGMSLFDAACAAVWFHAEIGVHIGKGLIAEDLTDNVRWAFRHHRALE